MIKTIFAAFVVSTCGLAGSVSAADYDGYTHRHHWHHAHPHIYVPAYTYAPESYVPAYTHRRWFGQGYNYAAQPYRYGYGYGQGTYPTSTIAYVPTVTYRPVRVYYTPQTQPFYNVPPYLGQ